MAKEVFEIGEPLPTRRVRGRRRNAAVPVPTATTPAPKPDSIRKRKRNRRNVADIEAASARNSFVDSGSE